MSHNYSNVILNVAFQYVALEKENEKLKSDLEAVKNDLAEARQRAEKNVC